MRKPLAEHQGEKEDKESWEKYSCIRTGEMAGTSVFCNLPVTFGSENARTWREDVAGSNTVKASVYKSWFYEVVAYASEPELVAFTKRMLRK